MSTSESRHPTLAGIILDSESDECAAVQIEAVARTGPRAVDPVAAGESPAEPVTGARTISCQVRAAGRARGPGLGAQAAATPRSLATVGAVTQGWSIF